MKTYPEQYLHIRDNRSGEEYLVPFEADEPMALEAMTDRWIAEHSGGELVRDGAMTRSIDGDYYARIMTDGRSPESVCCWDGAGFYLTGAL